MGDGDLSDEILGKPRRDPQQPNAAPDGSISDMVLNGPDAGMLRRATDGGLQTNPTTAARILRMQARTGIGEDILSDPKHLEEVEQLTKRADFDPENFREKSPLMAKWLSESKNRVAVMHPDLGGLADLGDVYRMRNDPFRPLLDEEIKTAAERRAKYRADLASFQSDFMVDPSTGLTQSLPKIPPEDFYQKFLVEEMASRRAENEFAKNPKKVGFWESMGQTWRGNPLFAVPVGGQLPVLQNALELKGAADRVHRGKGSYENYDLDMDTLTRYARMQKAAQSRGMDLGGHLAELGAGLPAFIMEMAMTGGLAAPAKAGAKLSLNAAAKFAGETAFQAAITQGPKVLAGTVRRQTPAGEAVADEQGNLSYQFTTDKGESAWLSLGKESLSSFFDIASTKIPFGPLYKLLSKEGGEVVAKSLTERVLRVGKEGVKGAFSGITINEATKLAKALTMVGPAYELPTWGDLGGQGITFGILGMIHGAQEKKADNTHRTLDTARGIIDSLEATTKEPQLVEQALAAGLKGSDSEFGYIPKDKLREFYQGKGLDPRAEIEKVLGSAEKYDQATDKQKIQIPTSRYAMTIDRDPEASKFLQPHFTFDPMDASKAELEEKAKAAKESAAKKSAGANSDIPLPTVLAQSPEGLQGQPYADLIENQRKAADAFINSLQPGRYRLTRPDGSTVNADAMRLGDKVVLVGENAEVIDGAGFMHGRYTDNSGATKYEPGYKISRAGGKPEPARNQEADESARKVGKVIQSRMKELGLTREAEAFGKIYEERYKARAERRQLGEQPLELFDKQQLGIFKREGPGGEIPEGEAQYVRVLEQGGHEHVERVQGTTPAEAVLSASHAFPDATIEPMTPEEVKSLLSDAMGGGPREFMQGSKKQADSPEFKTWFGNSKVVDENGAPKVQYHVTRDNLDRFDARRGLVASFGTEKSARDRFKHLIEDGLVTRSGRDLESGGAANTLAVFLRIENPVRMSDVHFDEARTMLDDLVERGVMTKEESNSMDPDIGEFGISEKEAQKKIVEFLKSKGYDGIVYKNNIEDPGQDTYIPFDPKQIKSATGNRGTFEPKTSSLFRQPGQGPPRGSIEFGSQGVDINLFRNADRSTFLHESWHGWFDELIQDATTHGVPEQLTKDLDTILEWLGTDVRAVQGAGAVRRGLTEQQQEKLAAAGEAYFMKGEAPSAELRGVFFKFSEWLKKIYKTLLGLEQQSGQKLDMSPEVRSAMDRMLATDAQIQEAKQTEGVQSLLAHADWVPPEIRAQLGTALAEVDQASKEELNQKLMAEVRKEESDQWDREREGLKAEITAEVDQRPEQIALANLERGTKPDGSPLGEGDLPPLKISLDSVPKEQRAGLPRKIFAKEGGVSPDEAAEYFNLSSGDELLSKFREMRAPQTPEAREIQARLDGLELQRKLLLDQKQPLEAEKEETVKALKAGRKTLANKLEVALRDQEKAQMEPILEILNDIKERGGIDPSTPTEDLPKKFRSKKAGTGVGSDEIAQELADRGHLDYPDSDALYKKLAEWEQQVKDSKERMSGVSKEAKRLAGERVSNSIEALIDNSTQQERLRVQLARLQSEAAAFRKEHQVNQRAALIDRLADEKMHERFPDMLTDGTLPAEASKVVYNAQRAKLMARQLELLAEYKLPSMKQAVAVLAKRGGFSELMRAQAEETVAGQKIRELTPGIYKSAARQAGNDAVKAFNKGDWKGLFDHLRDEMLNHELYRAAEKVRDAVDDGTAYMNRFNKTDVQARIGKAGGDYLDQIYDLMDRFDFRKITLRRIDRRISLREWYTEQVRLAQSGDGYMPDIPPKVLDEAFRTNYREMTYEEFQDVVDTAKNIEHLADLKNSLLASVEKRTFNEAVDRSVAGIVANSPGPRKVSLQPRAPGLEKNVRTVAGFFASHRKMASLAREMDGFKDGGAIWDLLIRPANKAGQREASMHAEAAEAFDKLLDLYSPADQLRMSRKEYIPEIKDSLDRWGQIMVALNSGNEGNLQRLKDGYRWSDQQIKAIHDRLTEKDWAFARGVAEMIETYWPEIRDLQKRVTGLEPEKVEAKPFMTKFGMQPGWYFPIVYEPILDPGAAEHADVEAAKPTLLGASIRSTTKHGHREARMEHVEKPVMLDPSVISRHVNQVIHDLTHFEFVSDTNRLLSNEKLRSAIVTHYGDQNFAQLKDWVKDIAVGNVPASSAGEYFLNWIRQGSVIARLGWNLKQMITDQTGIFQGMQRVGPVWVAKGWAQIGGDAARLENAFAKIEAKSEMMRNRGRTRLREINEVMGEITKKGMLELAVDVGLDKATAGHVDLQDIRNTFFDLMAKAQKMQDGPVWLGAYEKALSEHKVDAERSVEDRERVEALAVDLADQAVLDSFGGGQMKDLARIQRGGAALKVFTTFGSFANATLQRNIEAVKRFSRAPKTIESSFKLASDIFLVNILPAAITTAIGYGLSNNRKDKKRLKSEILADQGAQIINQITFGREFSPALHGQDYEGPAGTETIQTGSRLLKSSIEAMKKHDIKKVDLDAANQTAGSLFHYPAGFVQRVANAIAAAKHGPVDSMKALFGGHRQKK